MTFDIGGISKSPDVAKFERGELSTWINTETKSVVELFGFAIAKTNVWVEFCLDVDR